MWTLLQFTGCLKSKIMWRQALSGANSMQWITIESTSGDFVTNFEWWESKSKDQRIFGVITSWSCATRQSLIWRQIRSHKLLHTISCAKVLQEISGGWHISVRMTIRRIYSPKFSPWETNRGDLSGCSSIISLALPLQWPKYHMWSM